MSAMPDYTLPLDQLPDPLPIEPLTRPFDVTITPPGSKSITCRAYVLAALAEGESKIIRPLHAEDTDKLLDALCTLGAAARWDGEDVYITGVAGRFPHGGEVNLGDGGTPTRFMIACACLAAEPVVVDGSTRMRERPIAEGVDMLRQLGAHIEYVEEEGRLPVRVTPSDEFIGGELTIGRTASSQFVSALMLISTALPSGLQLQYPRDVTSASYVALTRFVMREFGVTFGDHAYSDRAPKEDRIPPQQIQNREYRVFADASSAVYWLLAVALVDDARARLKPYFPTLPSDLRSQRELGQPDFGVFVVIRNADAVTLDFRSSLLIRSNNDRAGINADAGDMPDGALALSVYAACAGERSTITDLHTLRVKETDRIAALANELRKVGCEVETTDDSITITPMALTHGRDARATDGTLPSNPVTIETYNDHRMAMAFAILGLVRPGISIRNPACVAKSYPTFWQDFARLYQ